MTNNNKSNSTPAADVKKNETAAAPEATKDSGSNAPGTPATAQDKPQGNTPATSPVSAKPAAAPAKKAQAESEYSADDLAAVARQRFGVTPEAVAAALKIAGVKQTTLTEAQRIVKQFLGRKV